MALVAGLLYFLSHSDTALGDRSPKYPGAYPQGELALACYKIKQKNPAKQPVEVSARGSRDGCFLEELVLKPPCEKVVRRALDAFQRALYDSAPTDDVVKAAFRWGMSAYNAPGQNYLGAAHNDYGKFIFEAVYGAEGFMRAYAEIDCRERDNARSSGTPWPEIVDLYTMSQPKFLFQYVATRYSECD